MATSTLGVSAMVGNKPVYTQDYEFLDSDQKYVVKNVPCKVFNNNMEEPVFSAKVSMKVATLIDLMRSREIAVNELDYQDFAHIEVSL
ncbi:hypothetical protein SLU01_01430 [Sporosarcina luteola]|uniref:Uncharacterized protein n=1 Tax=Sporosarcina luteola TaxID=582850 RepID=A0A511Z310_9BACL|nr:hypothetical protein [Sporosarcina luteola]GEN81831.1 hypothetical protein SLU01_01430 [Sporosarcina luteola]